MTWLRGSVAVRTLTSVATGSTLVAWWGRDSGLVPVFGSSVIVAAMRKRPKMVAAAAGIGICVAAASTGSWLLIGLCAAAAVAYLSPTLAMAAYPVAAIWTPKFAVVSVGDELVFARADHALILGAALRCVLTSRSDAPGPFRTLLLFGVAALASTAAGVARGTVASPEMAAPLMAQFAYLGLVFVCAAWTAPRLGETGVYAWALPVMALAAYGVAEQLSPLAQAVWNYRTFERGLFDGQANHAAGLFVVGALFGLALARSSRWRILGLSMAAVTLAALPGTGSREALAAFVGGLCCLGVLVHPVSMAFVLPAAAVATLALPSPWWDRLAMPGGSLHDRFAHWKAALDAFSGHPILGLGLGAAHRRFYDNQYVMLLAETGVIGTGLFTGWLAALARSTYHASKGPAGPIALGALAGLAAASVQGLAAVTFVVTLLAGPLFWLTGYALGISRNELDSSEEKPSGV